MIAKLVCKIFGHRPRHKMRCMICDRCYKVLYYHDEVT